MYAITTTPGFIIHSRPYGEAGKLLSIFTRDLGLVMATAQGIRLEKSKLRYHSQEYSLGTFSFVRGKEFWRLTSADQIRGSMVEPPAENARFSQNEKVTKKVVTFQNSQNEHAELIARIALLLRRLLHGEEAHPELFVHIEQFMQALELKPSEEQLKSLESIAVLRILHCLGYVRSNADVESAIGAPLSLALLEALKDKRVLMNQHINKALRESHL